MHIFRRFKLAKWYTKIIVVMLLLSLVPIMLGGFLVATQYIRWQRDKDDLMSGVRAYHQHIVNAERRHSKISVKDEGNGLKGPKPSIIYDRYKRVIGEFNIDDRVVVPYKNIPRLLVRSVLAMEDTEFFRHNGVNIKRIFNAMVEHMTGGRKIGGSTITQQLAKQLFTDRTYSLRRKIFEFFGAKALESNFSKKDILLMYLNRVCLGRGVFGVEAASQLYFNKPTRMLNVYECALLTGIIPLPEVYSPLSNIDAAKRKHIQTLNRMVQLGIVHRSVLNSDFEKFWDDLEKKLSAPTVSFWNMKVNKAPYFTEYIRQRLQKYFKDDEIRRGGLKIYTTLDVSLQQNAEKAVRKGLKKVEKAKEKQIREWVSKQRRWLRRKMRRASVKKQRKLLAEWKIKREAYLKKFRKPIEGALVSMDASNGYVLAMVGGRNYMFKNQNNRAIYAKRQFGSSMKPLVYTSAIQHNIITAATIMKDKRRKYNTPLGPWSPKNYDNQYLGDISIRKALMFSINTVAVETIHRLGASKVASAINKIFFGRFKHKGRRGCPAILSLPLGSLEVSPLDGARLYCTLASGGWRVKPLFIRRIVSRKGKLLYNFETGQVRHTPIVRKRVDDKNKTPDTLNFDNDNAITHPEQVFDSRAVYITTDMMRDVLNKGTGAYARAVSSFYLNAAGKSGTSDKNRDAWFSGYVKKVVAVVWVGFDDDKTPLPKTMTGGIAAGPIWSDFMKRSFWAHGQYSFPRPDGIKSVLICRDSSQIAADSCTNTYKEFFMDGTQPTSTCLLEHGMKYDPSQDTNSSSSSSSSISNASSSSSSSSQSSSSMSSSASDSNRKPKPSSLSN